MLNLSKIFSKFIRPNKATKIILQEQSAKNNPIDFKTELKKNPLDAEIHFQYGKSCLSNNNCNLAIAEFKTSISLGMRTSKAHKLIELAQSNALPLTKIEHNQYYRFKTLSEEIKSLTTEQNYSVLDIGGGHGILSQFIPEANYCLVEPDVNGISGIDLPFQDNSFDFVVACHVLEHIPPNERDLFLDQLCAKAKQAVILLNPFEIDGISTEKRLELFIEITGARWAKEHLECGLPRVETVTDYLEKRNMKYSIKPNGNISTSMAMVFVDYFAGKANYAKDNQKISEFFNTQFYDLLSSPNFPTAYLITIKKESTDNCIEV